MNNGFITDNQFDGILLENIKATEIHFNLWWIISCLAVLYRIGTYTPSSYITIHTWKLHVDPLGSLKDKRQTTGEATSFHTIQR